MAEMMADLESPAPDMPIGRARDVAGGALRRVGARARRLEAVLGEWRRVEAPMVEIEADLESAAPDLPIGRATAATRRAQRRVGGWARRLDAVLGAWQRVDRPIGGFWMSPEF
jgi:hypothetical protein